MNPWDFLWTVMGWCALVLVVLGGLILAFAALAILWGVVKSHVLPHFQTKKEREAYDKEAKAIALNMSAAGQLNQNPAQAFLQGAVWAWGALHRKK